MGLLLDSNELFELTGFKQKAKQIAWLRKHRIPFAINRLGKPVVVRAKVEKMELPGKTPSTEPNWSAIGGSRLQQQQGEKR